MAKSGRYRKLQDSQERTTSVNAGSAENERERGLIVLYRTRWIDTERLPDSARQHDVLRPAEWCLPNDRLDERVPLG